LSFSGQRDGEDPGIRRSAGRAQLFMLFSTINGVRYEAMRFHRFTVLGKFTNWGWYSPQEQELLDLEVAVGTAITELEDFIRTSESLSVPILRYRIIQTNTDVRQEEYAKTKLDLEQIEQDIKKQRRKILNSGAVPDSQTIFKNHHPEALIGEIQSFLSYQLAQQAMGNNTWRQMGFRVKYQQDPELFKEIMESGIRVLYTVSVDNRLTIGDPRSTKHSVVAAGVDCKAAGAAQLKLSPKTDTYLTLKQYEEEILVLEKKMESPKSKDDYLTFKENRDYKITMAKELETGLNGWQPPADEQRTRKVMIDFDSGHYAPHSAWKEAMAAWIQAGYEPRWAKDSRRV
jgi:hypothetical protein